jgi:hypothetical protein
MRTVTLSIKNVNIPGIPAPVSGQVEYLPPASWDYAEGGEIVQAELELSPEDEVAFIRLPEAYGALLMAAEEEYSNLLEEIFRNNLSGDDSDLPF